MEKIVSKLLNGGFLNGKNNALIVYETVKISQQLRQLNEYFPASSLHAIAIKANPLLKILELIKRENFGLEAASLPEVYLAQRAGVPNDKIVFDSPAKTLDEIVYALDQGIRINADSLAELNRIEQYLKNHKSASVIGVRVNPQLGEGRIKATSVAGKISKFGIPLQSNKKELIDAFMRYDFLDGLHVHIGSQGIALEQLVDGVSAVYNLAEDLSAMGKKLRFIDIGGGVPVEYKKTDPVFSIGDYTTALRKPCPKLFSGAYQLITEFGRFVHAKAAFAISRVEYVKEIEDQKIISIHLGADFMLRKAYNPSDWYHEIKVMDEEGKWKEGRDDIPYTVAGPLCFGGDILAREIYLPHVEEGDYVVLLDVGAYTLSMWSRYNSRQLPAVLAYDEQENAITTLRERERPEDLVDFWT